MLGSPPYTGQQSFYAYLGRVAAAHVGASAARLAPLPFPVLAWLSRPCALSSPVSFAAAFAAVMPVYTFGAPAEFCEGAASGCCCGSAGCDGNCAACSPSEGARAEMGQPHGILSKLGLPQGEWAGVRMPDRRCWGVGMPERRCLLPAAGPLRSRG